MRVLHLITGLGAGGAENMLLRLLREGSRRGLAGEPSVISLGRPAALAPAIEALGVPLVRLGAGSAAAMPLRLPALVAAARRARPDLVQGWMVHGNLAASAVAPLLPGAPRVAWNVRQSLNDLGSERRSTRVLIRLAARLSRRPAAILYNSRTGAEHHRAIGYAGERTLIVPNGFDLERFRPDPAARERLRAELGVGEAPLVGLVARWDPVKDHAGFLAAMAELSARFPDLRLLLAGSGVDPANDELRALVDGAGLAGRAQLLGERDDVPALLAALDVAVNCSTTEAFANAIGEAMACGVPCAVTDVGDSAAIVGDAGEVVPPRAPAALAAAVGRLLALAPAARQALAARARARIAERYSLAAMVRRYDEIYRRLSAGEPAAATARSDDDSAAGDGADTASSSP